MLLNKNDKCFLEVSQVSRSLRVFSMYLIDESHPLNFAELVSGKRLFRMSASEFGSSTNTDFAPGEIENNDDDLKILKSIILLLDDAKVNSKAQEVKCEILNVLAKYKGER